MEAMRLMNWRMAWRLDTGEPDPAFASAIKAYSTECLIAVDKLMLNVTGMAGGLRRGSPGAALNGDLEEHYRKCQINTFGGGVAEVMRDLIAQFGAGHVGVQPALRALWSGFSRTLRLNVGPAMHRGSSAEATQANGASSATGAAGRRVSWATAIAVGDHARDQEAPGPRPRDASPRAKAPFQLDAALRHPGEAERCTDVAAAARARSGDRARSSRTGSWSRQCARRTPAAGPDP
jgi:hypothetical protein